jgi:hypothetical protein
MSRVILDRAALAHFAKLVQPVEVCDQTGNVVGRFIPRLDPNEYDLEPQISEKEIEERSKSSEPTYTTAEVFAHLERL